jgi:hypothetical protein
MKRNRNVLGTSNVIGVGAAPDIDNASDLGSATKRFRTAYAEAVVTDSVTSSTPNADLFLSGNGVGQVKVPNLRLTGASNQIVIKPGDTGFKYTLAVQTPSADRTVTLPCSENGTDYYVLRNMTQAFTNKDLSHVSNILPANVAKTDAANTFTQNQTTTANQSATQFSVTNSAAGGALVFLPGGSGAASWSVLQPSVPASNQAVSFPPAPGTATTFVLADGASTINNTRTYTGQGIYTGASNQLAVQPGGGVAKKFIFTASAPAQDTTLTWPDPGAAAGTFALLERTQTFTGANTFNTGISTFNAAGPVFGNASNGPQFNANATAKAARFKPGGAANEYAIIQPAIPGAVRSVYFHYNGSDPGFDCDWVFATHGAQTVNSVSVPAHTAMADAIVPFTNNTDLSLYGSGTGRGVIATYAVRISTTYQSLSVLTSTFTLVNFTAGNGGTVDYTHGPSSQADLANSQLVCAKTGIYSIRGKIVFPGNTAGSRLVSIFVNGINVDQHYFNPSATGNWTTVHIVTHQSLVSGDVVQLKVWQNSGATLTLSPSAAASDNSVLSMNLLSVA